MAFPNHRTWVEVSASALRGNLLGYARTIGRGPKIMPIIKANAYGHGMLQVAKTLAKTQIWGFGVAYAQEALDLRTAGVKKPILVLSSWQTKELAGCLRQNIDLVAWDIASLRQISAAARAGEKMARVHLKIDTGTTRIGFLPTDLPELASAIQRLPNISVSGIFSHLANAEEQQTSRTNQQLKHFTTLVNVLNLPGGVRRHVACTAAGLRYPAGRHDIVRLGIGLYGLWPSAVIRRSASTMTLQPALSWYSRLQQVKWVSAGTAIGYGSTVKAKRRTMVGIIPVGYADGYDRGWSNRAWVMINGRRAPVLGRICMNLMMVDCTRNAECRAGSMVTLIGPGIAADDLAGLIDTLNYEIVTRINWDIPRIIIP